MSTRSLVSAVLVATTLGVAALFGWQQYQSYQRSEQCVEDVLHAVHELYEVRSHSKDPPFEDAYYIQQHITDARRLLSIWISDGQSDRRQIAQAAQDAVTEFERAAQLFMEISRGSGDDEKLAEFKVKVESARSRLIDLAAVYAKHQPPLTKANKRHLISYIDIVFTKQLLEENAAPKDDPKAPFYPEIFAASVIRRALEHP
jgi:hypothetical protein